MASEVIDLCCSSDEGESDFAPPPPRRVRQEMITHPGHPTQLKQQSAVPNNATSTKCPFPLPGTTHDLHSLSNVTSAEKQQIDYFELHCFGCEVPLCNPKERNLEASCYALHVHPVLKIPVCSVCSDEIAAVEVTATSDDDDVCRVCADTEADQLFLCDGSDCSRPEVCDQCVRKANPLLSLEDLEASNRQWYCPFCQPTSTVQALQAYVVMMQEQSPSDRKVDIDALLEDLEVVEQKKLECEENLDQQDIVNQEIHKELVEELQAQEEFDSWKEQQEKHHSRIVDMITTLQEELERQGYNLKQYYAAAALEKKPKEEPEWKRIADTAIATREIEDRKQGPPKPPTPQEEISDDDLLPDNVEDLGSLSGGESRDAEENSQWRSSQYRAQPWQIKRALQAEEKLLSQQNRPVPVAVSEVHDEEAIGEEDRLSARVRRDSLVVVRQCQQRRRQQSARIRSPARRQAVEPSKSPRPTSRLSPNQRSPSLSHRSRSISREEGEWEEEEGLPVAPMEALDLFANSSCILTSDPRQHMVRVAEPLDKVLKPHQKEGIQFMFQNSFHDLAFPEEILTDEVKKNIGGCILAHNMGLGKSLSCVTLLHTLFFHPLLAGKNNRPTIHTVVLVAPVNTLRNWENEFDKWTNGMSSSIVVHNLADDGNRGRTIRRWAKQGGVLLTSDALFRNIVKKMEFEVYLRSPGPDVIVLDEAHAMLKNKKNAVFKALNGVKTRRRICLTGSPFQNNLFEFFRMASYVRPGVLGNSEANFEREYVNPIVSGISTDATSEAKRLADEKLNEIQELLQQYVQRKDASILLQDLPPMQQVVLHIRQTKVQRSLYGAYKRHQQLSEDRDSMNFLRMISILRPVHNHPGCLLLREPKTWTGNGTLGAFNGDGKKPAGITTPTRRLSLTRTESNASPPNINQISKEESETNIAKVKAEIVLHDEREKIATTLDPSESKELDEMNRKDSAVVIDLLSDSEEEIDETTLDDDIAHGEWWSTVLQKTGTEKLSEVESGNKVLLLLHILTHADTLNEKVVLFSQCLKTLDFISNVIAQDDWPSLVPSLDQAFPGHRIGGWKAGRHFLRIDGATSAGDRGDRISQFNENSVRLFLISSRAGGVGINLCSASRVILFDSSFNPSVDMQALYRCYRYGQKRDVFAYRFLTEGTTEGKVYSRAVNKSGLALSLIDGKTFQRVFSEEETADFSKTDTWAICDRCNQWRMFPPDSIDAAVLPDKWYCEMMNEHDKSTVIDCSFQEKDEPWYFRHHGKMKESKVIPERPIMAMSGNEVANLSDDKKERLAARDEILMHLLAVSTSKKQSKVVSRYTFHDALLDKEETEKVVAFAQKAPTPQGVSSPTSTTSSVSERTLAKAEKLPVSKPLAAKTENIVAECIESTVESKEKAVSNLTKMSQKRNVAEADFDVSSIGTKAKLHEKTAENPRRQKKKTRVSLGQPKQRRRIDFKSLWAGEDMNL